MATVDTHSIRIKGYFRPGDLVTTRQYAIIAWAYHDETMLYDYTGVLKAGEIAVVAETIKLLGTTPNLIMTKIVLSSGVSGYVFEMDLIPYE